MNTNNPSLDTNRKKLINLLNSSIKNCSDIFDARLSNKIHRLINHPIKMLIRKIDIKLLRRKYAIPVKARAFWGEKMNMFSFEQGLYLCGFINHDPEVRLTKFIIRNIGENETFFDIGSHHGFYSLLANKVLRSKINIYSFEPSPVHFNVLRKNTKKHRNILINKLALSSAIEEISFYENNKGVSTIKKEVSEHQSKLGHSFYEIRVQTNTLDQYCKEKNVSPTFIKIDVEGAEFEVLRGAQEVLKKYNPVIAIEIWGGKLGNQNHKKAVNLLTNSGYKPFKINDDGTTTSMEKIDFGKDIDPELQFDNFIFKHLV